MPSTEKRAGDQNEMVGVKGAGDRLARYNAWILAAAAALAGANASVVIATSGLVGRALTGEMKLATIPVLTFVLGTAASAFPAAFSMRRFGRRNGFAGGALFGVVAGLLGATAIVHANFALFCLATSWAGAYQAFVVQYRFAAADTATPAYRPRAIALALGGGVASAFVGTRLVNFTQDLWVPYLFAATYLAQSLLAVIAGVVLMFLDIPVPPRRPAEGEGRPLLEIARQPRFIVAVACGVASYSMMNLVMTSAPLAMVMCDHSVTEASLGLQWHVLGMFVPSFITGTLIARFGVERIIATGFALLLASATINLTGITIWHFWVGLVLLGFGWNFGFIGATVLVAQCHHHNERNRVQAFNDFLVFGSMAIGSFSSGKLLHVAGWGAVNMVVFPTVLAAAALLAWGVWRRRRGLAQAV